MSTNKTPNYQLHSWLPADEFHLSEINENFTKLDRELALETEALQDTFADEVTGIKTTLGRKVEIVVGKYAHTNEANLTISLGRKPAAVLIEAYNGARSLNSPYGMLVTEDINYCAKLTEDGFTIVQPDYLNSSGSYHVYIAFFLE